MPLRRLAVSATILTALLMLGGSAFAAPAEADAAGGASHLPAPCVAAGAKTEAECQALLHRAAPSEKPAAKTPEAPAAAEKPAPAAEPAAPKPEVAKPEAPKPEVAKPSPPKPETAKPPAPKPEVAKPPAPKPAAASPAEPKPAAEASKPAAQSEATGTRQRADCTGAEAAKLPACAGERQHRRGPNGAAAGAEPAAPAAEAKPEATAPAKPEPAAPAKPEPAAPAKPAPAAPAKPALAAPAPTAPAAAEPAAPAASAKPAAPTEPAAGISAACAAAGIDSASACRRYEFQHHEKPGAEAPAQPTPASPAKPTAPATPAAPAPAAPAAAAPAPQATRAAPAAPTGAKGTATPAPAAPATPATPVAAGGQLPPECLAVGISTAAQCDAFQTRRHHRGTPGAGQGPAGADQQNATGKQPLEPVTKLPAGVTNDQLAPLLDSAKQREIGGGRTPPSGKPAATAPQAPPPSNDEAAQAKLRVRKAPPLQPPGATPVAGTPPTTRIQLPQDVTVVNQTVVNNTTVNSSTVNNTTVNNNTAVVENGRPGRPGGPSGRGPGGRGGPGGMPGAFPPPPGEPVPPGAREVNPIGLAIGAVLQLGDRLIVDSSGRDQYRMSGGGQDRTDYAELSGNRYMETIYRPHGIRIVTIYDRDGDVLRRSRFDQDGRETVLAYFDYSRDKSLGQWQDPGASLPPLQLDVNVNNYVLDASQADEGSLQRFLGQPPVEPVPRLYSIDEVERSARLRDIMPRVELTDLTFDTGSATLAPDQVQELGGVADAMLALLQRNPAETFLVEGHTDAVGSPASNLVLSDARAAAVAEVLTEVYHVPPENLATQGYGSEFLRIQTADSERLNRRVVVRRITPLVTIAQSDN